ncbi:MAG: hypothetical protein RIS36_476 [Pseudomonadota bacterium]|jgi:hypothetical protein
MAEMSLNEAQLFRLLVGFFGKDRVLFSMSVRAVCGGDLSSLSHTLDEETRAWAERNRCLFTVVDAEDDPRMVVEFEPDFSTFIEVDQLERKSRLPAVLKASGVQYLTITGEEMGEILNPNGTIGLVDVLKDRFGIEDTTDPLDE